MESVLTGLVLTIPASSPNGQYAELTTSIPTFEAYRVVIRVQNNATTASAPINALSLVYEYNVSGVQL